MNNPCEEHKKIKTDGYCPICLINERDALQEKNITLLEALKFIVRNRKRFEEYDLDGFKKFMIDDFAVLIGEAK